jgi:hypothetical protein
LGTGVLAQAATPRAAAATAAPPARLTFDISNVIFESSKVWRQTSRSRTNKMSYTLSIYRRRNRAGSMKRRSKRRANINGALGRLSEGAQRGFVRRPTPMDVDIAEGNGRPYASRAAEKSVASITSVFSDVSFANLV